MRYDFETLPNRPSNSVKWGNLKAGELPMWIAEMDFLTAPEILDTMREKIAVGAFGYEDIPDDYFEAIADWEEKAHGARPEEAWCQYVTGVVPAISSIVRSVTKPGDYVLTQAPVYDIFYHSIENNGRQTISSDLVYDSVKRQYRVDWDDLEDKLVDPLTKLFIFCNPHNPVGYVWTKDEVQKIADLCAKYHVVLLSDEIHADLVLRGITATPAFSVNGLAQDWVITLVSPSKTFNLAALHAACAIIPNRFLRETVTRGFNQEEIAEPNLLAIPATIAAYRQGGAWLNELKEVLRGNYDTVKSLLVKIPEVKLVESTATYLLWLDISELGTSSREFTDFLRKETGLVLSPGGVYRGNGDQFVRMNIAAPKRLVEDGMGRLIDGVNLFIDSR
ncbi:MalY/PatB family protein [Lactobacillus sp.]|uniref:MalY/PatB family protein n=1 Tax=Lactobacillus sp. TaxID=1591 RepID=UPI003EF307BB